MTTTPEAGTTAREIATRLRKNVKTVRRWIVSGVTIRGHTIRLAATMMGDRYHVTDDQLARFHAECTAARALPPAAPFVAPESPDARAARFKRAKAEALAELDR